MQLYIITKVDDATVTISHVTILLDWLGKRRRSKEAQILTRCGLRFRCCPHTKYFVSCKEYIISPLPLSLIQLIEKQTPSVIGVLNVKIISVIYLSVIN